MKNFFNAIGVADIERVHSAMIAWILDDANDPTLQTSTSSKSRFSTFPQAVRSKLLCDLFGVSSQKTFDSITTNVEWNDIDILIETNDGKGTKEVWVIENKLKSQEHLSNDTNKSGTKVQIWQTVKYENIIKKTFPNYQQHYMLLSLGGDKAQSTSGLWLSYTYGKLHQLISNVVNLGNYALIEEYVNAIGLIVSELNKFLKSKNLSKEYPDVFVKRSKADKAIKQKQGKITPEEKFIIENGLETIFQKQYLGMMINSYLPNIKNAVRYDERNGIAMFIYPITYISDFELNIEFQGGTYKVGLLHKDYQIKGSQKHTTRLYGKWNNKTGTGKPYIFFTELAGKGNGWRVATSKNLGSKSAKPRIAIDKNIGNNWYQNPNNSFGTVFSDATVLANQIKNGIKTIP